MLRLVTQKRLARKAPSSRAMAVGVLYFLLAELGHFLSFQGTSFATFWPAAGLLLAALVTTPRWEWPLVLLFSAAANIVSDVLLHEQPVWVSLSFWTANSLEVTTAAFVMQWWMRGRTRLTHFHHMMRLLAIGLCVPLLGAAIGAATVSTLDPAANFGITYRIWWAADVLGIVTVTPLILSFVERRGARFRQRQRWTRGRAGEAVALAAVLVLASWFIFSHPINLDAWPMRVRPPAMLLPILVWAALRFDLRGVTMANATVALIATYYASRGVGPFALSENVVHHALGLQIFFLLTTFTCLVLGAVATQVRLAEQQQRRLAGLLRDERTLLQSILNSIGDCVMVSDNHGRWLQFNPAAKRLCGLRPDEVPRPDLFKLLTPIGLNAPASIAPEQLPQQRALRGEAVEPGQQFALQVPGRDRSIITCTARPLQSPSGEVLGGVVVAHDITASAQAAAEREMLIAELQRALSEIKTLRGLIPMCASCKSIRDDDGYWQRLEAFLVEHTEAEFTHGICNDCGVKLYGDMWSEAMKISLPHMAPTRTT